MPRTLVNGVQLHYHLQGTGTPIVFLHPACIGSRIFTYLRDDLARDHRTLLFDFRGHGRSETSAARVTIPLLVEDACRLMDALELREAYLCAYSMGTMVALEALLAHPERFRGAVLISGMAEAKSRKTRMKLQLGQLAGKLKIRELLVLPQLWSNADNLYTYRRLRGETTAGDIVKWREYMEYALRYSAADRLPEIRQPVLLLVGEQDKESKNNARTLQQGLPHVSTAIIPGLKNAIPTHGADEGGALIRGWLHAMEGGDREKPAEAPDTPRWFPYEPAHPDPEAIMKNNTIR